MPTRNEITSAGLRRLAEIRADGPIIISAYLNLDPERFATAGARESEVRSLIDSGHRRVAYLSIPELEDESDRARWEGYRQAMKGAGAGAPMRISWSPPSDQARIDGSERTLLEVFAGRGRVTAVFASNDVAAIALQEFADRVGIRVPEDVSIVGFDDVPMAGLARIALTTVAQPRDELARLGIADVADRIERKVKGPPRTTLVDVSLVTRRSTAPLQADLA